MAVSERLKSFLDEAKVAYTIARHPVVYTAQEIAAAQHVPGRQLAKCVLIMTGDRPVLAVLPAVQLIALKKLKALLRAKRVAIAKEADIRQHFPDVEVGAMSPFGHLYQIPTIVDEALTRSEEIVFNAGSHTDTITMRYRDFASLAQPQIGSFGVPVGGAPAVKRRARPTRARRARRPAARPARAKRPASGRRRPAARRRR